MWGPQDQHNQGVLGLPTPPRYPGGAGETQRAVSWQSEHAASVCHAHQGDPLALRARLARGAVSSLELDTSSAPHTPGHGSAHLPSLPEDRWRPGGLGDPARGEEGGVTPSGHPAVPAWSQALPGTVGAWQGVGHCHSRLPPLDRTFPSPGHSPEPRDYPAVLGVLVLLEDPVGNEGSGT